MDDDGCKWCKWERSGNIDFHHDGFLTSRWSQGSTTAFPQRKWILWQPRRVPQSQPLGYSHGTYFGTWMLVVLKSLIYLLRPYRP
jgi:hypothetical protein